MLVLLVGACSFATARSPAHPRSCSNDHIAPAFDSAGVLVAAGALAIAPAVPTPDRDHERGVRGAAAVTGLVLAASAVYGFVVIDPEGCRAARVTVTDL
jgi:hypothetical protein